MMSKNDMNERNLAQFEEKYRTLLLAKERDFETREKLSMSCK